MYERRARGQAATGSDGNQVKMVPSRPEKAADQLKSMLIGASWREFEEGRYKAAVAHALNACRVTPWRLAVWSILLRMGVRAALPWGQKRRRNRSAIVQ
jgi:hypothetical protein